MPALHCKVSAPPLDLQTSFRGVIRTQGTATDSLNISIMASSKAMEAVFPEAQAVLREVDPEVASIIEDEKARQW